MMRVIRALGRRFTYDFLRNPYLQIGLAWGVLTGLLSFACVLAVGRVDSWGVALGGVPYSLFLIPLLVHPAACCLVAGVLGTLFVEECAGSKEVATGLRDPATGLYSREYMKDQLRTTLAKEARSGRTVTMLVLDVGDHRLANVAHALRRRFRPGDLLGRWSPDHRLLLIVGGELSCGLCLARRLAEEARLQTGSRLRVGVARWPEDGLDLESLQEAAEVVLQSPVAGGYLEPCDSSHPSSSLIRESCA